MPLLTSGLSVDRPASAMPAGQRIRPGRWLYFVSAAAFASGALLLGVLIVSLDSTLASTIHVIAPGTTDMTFAQSGTYTINYEYRTTLHNRRFNTPSQFPSIDLSLASTASGAPVLIRASSANLTYRVGGTRGTTIAEFTIDRPGTYTLTSQYRSGEGGPEIALAIGRGAPGAFTITVIEIVGASFLLLVGVLAGLGTLLSRRNAMGRARSTQTPG